MGPKWDIEKFTGDNDFGLWKVKMEAILIQQKCEKALKGEGVLPVTMSRVDKTEMVDKVRSAIVLCLGDKLLRDVEKEPTATSMWLKLESLYMTKSLTHRQFLKQQLYSFKMVEAKAIMEQLMGSFEYFKDTMLYGKEGTITLEEVQAALRTKELTKSKDLEIGENGKGLIVSSGNGGGGGNRRKSGNNSKFKCFNCNKMGHFMKDCLEINGNSS